MNTEQGGRPQCTIPIYDIHSPYRSHSAPPLTETSSTVRPCSDSPSPDLSLHLYTSKPVLFTQSITNHISGAWGKNICLGSVLVRIYDQDQGGRRTQFQLQTTLVLNLLYWRYLPIAHCSQQPFSQSVCF